MTTASGPVSNDGGWRMADGGWRMADGGWRMADGETFALIPTLLENR
jgi:hypothetical protein